MRLKSRLLGVLLTAWIASVAVLGLAVHLIVRQQLIEDATSGLERVTYLIHRELDAFFGERLIDLRVLAASADQITATRVPATRYLTRLRDAYGVLESLRLVSPDGTIIAETNQMGIGTVDPDLERFRRHSEGFHFTADPVRAKGSAELWTRLGADSGWIVAVVPLERLHDHLVDDRLDLRGMTVRLTTGEGLVLYDSLDPRAVGSRHPVTPHAVDSQWTQRDAQHLRVGASAPSRGPGCQAWDLMLAMPMERVLASLDKVLLVVLATMATALALGSFMIWRLSESLARPLRQLAEAVTGFENESSSRQRSIHVPAGASEEILTLHASLDHMAKRLGERFQDVLRAEERLSLALSITNTGLWDWEPPSGKVTFSPTWASMLGYTPEEIAQDLSSWSNLVHPEDLPGALAAVQSHLAGDSAGFRHEHRMQTKDGRWVWILTCGCVVTRDATGKALRMIGTHVDITFLKETQQRLEEARHEAEQAARAKADFLATMSHEIRTPMNGVLGMTSVLLSMRLESEQRDAVETIHRSGKALLTVLNDILDISKIEAGHLELQPSPFDPRQAIEDVLVLFRAQAAAKDLDLTGVYADDLPTVLMTDPNRFRQVLLNLVSNGIKFTDHGRIEVRARRLPPQEGAVHGLLGLEVVDTGIGIAAADLPRLFQRFSQVESGDRRRFGGTGLGLAISKHLIEAMGGTIGLESTPGQGSTFRIALPLPDPALGRQIHYHRPSSAEILTTPRVLLVEDNAVNRKVALLMLRSLGVEAEVVEDGAAAVEAWRRQPGRLVLMDCQMPIMDGFEATRRIRAEEQERGLAHTPIIALTAGVMDDDRRRCSEAGMDDLVAKPIESAELSRVLRNWA